MNKERKSYGLLVGVSRYEEERGDLPAAGRDIILMKLALTGGLKFNEDNFRVLGEQGAVEARSFARALSEFEGLIERDDTFILYFSGHGTREGLCFTDGMVNLQIAFCKRLGRDTFGDPQRLPEINVERKSNMTTEQVIQGKKRLDRIDVE